MVYIFNSQFGSLTMLDQWTGHGGVKWGQFKDSYGTYVNLPMREVFISYTN